MGEPKYIQQVVERSHVPSSNGGGIPLIVNYVRDTPASRTQGEYTPSAHRGCSWCLTWNNEGSRDLLSYSQPSPSVPSLSPTRHRSIRWGALLLHRFYDRLGQESREAPSAHANHDPGNAGNAAEDVNGIQGAEEVARRAKGLQDGNVDNHRQEHEDGRDQI